MTYMQLHLVVLHLAFLSFPLTTARPQGASRSGSHVAIGPPDGPTAFNRDREKSVYEKVDCILLWIHI